MPYRWQALNQLSDSLNATNVLSDDYKKTIMGYAFAISSEAYMTGQKEHSGRLVKETSKEEGMGTKKEWRP